MPSVATTLQLKLPQLATRTTLIPIYETLLENDVDGVFEALEAASRSYGIIIGTVKGDIPNTLRRQLLSLNRIQGVPSYMLVLYLLRRHDDLGISLVQIAEVTQTLVSFFVRRNLTEQPPTYELARLFMRIIDRLDAGQVGSVLEEVTTELLKVSASDVRFREALRGNVYEASTAVTKFMLAALAEQDYTNERHLDLWELRKGGKALWTVEHVFPQGENIPSAWVDMIAGGDRTRAEELKDQYVHTLGNLTLSGYNSNLGNKAFHEKQSRSDQQGRPVGYNNGLSINRELMTADSWTIEQIAGRTEQLAEEIFGLFPLR